MKAQVNFSDSQTLKTINCSVEFIHDNFSIFGEVKVSIDSGDFCDEFEFEPSYFADLESENFYNENWEQIESAIISQFEKTIINNN